MKERDSLQTQQMSTFGAHIKAWRSLQGISASSLAARAGISRNTLAQLEGGTGNTTLGNLFAVLAALGIAESVVEAAAPAASQYGRELIYRKTRNG